MYLATSPGIQDGELPAHVNPGNGTPWAVIRLAQHVSIADLSLADCDRIIIAATTAKRRLSAALAGQLHEYRDALDDMGHCDACGLLPRDAIHAAPCPAVAPHSGAVCTRPAGHKGFHESGHTRAIVWEDDSVASDEAAADIADAYNASVVDGYVSPRQQAAAVLAASIASGQPVIVTDDEPLPDCGWCGHAETVHDRPIGPVATGPCAICRCTAYALPGAVPEVCGLPVWGDPDLLCSLFAGHEPMLGCPGHAARPSLRSVGGAS